MTPIAAQLVGRTAELEALDQALTELRRGRAAAVELSGEPGMGKTRLLAELAARAEERDQLVLSGSASELEGDLPFWVFVDALDEYVRGLPPRSLAALDDDVRAELGHVLPAFAPQRPGTPVERFRLHRALRELLETLAATKPVVLLLRRSALGRVGLARSATSSRSSTCRPAWTWRVSWSAPTAHPYPGSGSG